MNFSLLCKTPACETANEIKWKLKHFEVVIHTGNTEDNCINLQGVAEVVLSNEKRLNVMGDGFFNELDAIFKLLHVHPAVSVVLIWAKGRIFTAGLDLKEASTTLMAPTPNVSRVVESATFLKIVRKWQKAIDAISNCSKPTIAAVDGKCIGGGVDLITAADFSLSSKSASFAIQETKMAIVADLGTLQRITAIVGKGIAREMAFTGDAMNAERALQVGLVNQVYDNKEQLLHNGRLIARRIASHSPLALQGIKQVLNFSDSHTEEDGKEYVALWNTAFFKSDDLQEALSSFLNRSTPLFRNRL